MSSPPRISVVIPSYQQGRFLDDCLRSLVSQGYPDLEIIAMDGGSQDESVDVLHRWEASLAYWTSGPDRGQSHAINSGFEKATGELLAWLNCDDRLEPGALQAVAEAAAACPDAGVYVGAGSVVDEEGRELRRVVPRDLTFESFSKWMEGGDILQPACFFRRRSWEAAGPLDESLHVALDLDLWLRMLKHARFEPIDRLLARAIRHDRGKSSAHRTRGVVEASLVLHDAGAHEAARRSLERLADDLTHYRASYRALRTNFLVRLVRGFRGHPVKRRDVVPNW